MQSPLIFPLICIINTSLYLCGYMTLSSALLLFLLAVGWLWYKNQLTTSIVLCSIFLTGTSYIRFISLQKQFTYSQTLTEAKLAGYGYITDISPNQRKPKTATFAMYPYNKHSKILCHTRIPQTLDIKPDDIIFIKHLGTSPYLNHLSY